MNFENEKKQCLAKIDKSKKQSVDRGIRKIVDLLNSSKNYYTTSSCSGRIMLIEKPESGKKHDTEWLFVSHDNVDVKNIKKSIKGKNAWFKQEGAILHVCCKSLDDAGKLLDIVKEAGFKRSGLINFKNRKIIEIISTDLIEAPVANDGNLVVDVDYLNLLVNSANSNMESNRKRMENLHKLLTTAFG